MLNAGLAAFGDDQIDGFGADELHVGAGGIEMRVVGDDVAFLAHATEQDALGGTALVRGDDVAIAEDVLDGSAKLVEAAAAGVAFVAFHDGGPLVGGHGAGAGIGEEVDEHVIGVEEEEIVVGVAEVLLALRRGWSSGWVRRS